MIEVLRQKLALLKTNEEKYSILREYLQLLILRIIEIKGYYKNIAFVGGTSLRLLYDLNRFSEDLDFCLTNGDDYHFAEFLGKIKAELEYYGFSISLTFKDSKTVNNAFIKFNDILYLLGLTNNKSQILSIKLEIDTKPPQGFNTIFTPINKNFLLNIHHYNLPSLFSGKLHAVLCGPYAKGRDYYDLYWFLSSSIEPNIIQLNNAYMQTNNEIVDFTMSLLKEKLSEKINSINFKNLYVDVSPFIIDENELRFLDKEVLLNAVNRLWKTVNREQ